MTLATLSPVLIHGRTVWDLAELPRDEYEERARAVGKLLESNRLPACLIAGAADTYGNIAYLTGGRPGFMATVLLFHPEHGTVLFAGLGGARDLYHVRTVNCVGDVRYRPSVADGAREALAEWGLEDGPLGVVGLERDIPFRVADRLEASLGAFTLSQLDSAFAQLRRRKRPRELMLLQRSAELAESARREAVVEFLGSRSPRRAALAAERAARVGGARDVRVLANPPDGAGMRPTVDVEDGTARQLLLHVALERSGYWVESTSSFPHEERGAGARARAALAAMRDALRPGAPLSSVAGAAIGALGENRVDDTAALGFGQAVGLGVEPDGEIRLGAHREVEPGEVYVTRCIVLDGQQPAATSQVLAVGVDGARPLGAAW